MKIGVIGGGQLGRMLALAGTPLGMNFAFLDPAPDACAASLGEHIRADYGDQDHLRQLADEVDLVTFEFESVPAETVAFLSQFVPVYPSAEALRIARDRWFEKSMFKDLGIPTPAFADIQSQADLDAAVASIGLPAVGRSGPHVGCHIVFGIFPGNAADHLPGPGCGICLGVSGCNERTDGDFAAEPDRA